ncbi:hypothetical protein ABID62_008139, partial [Bradyrhizobium sp. S3.9.1]
RSNTPLSCKIEYYIKTNSAYFSDQSAFFTDDSRADNATGPLREKVARSAG